MATSRTTRKPAAKSAAKPSVKSSARTAATAVAKTAPKKRAASAAERMSLADAMRALEKAGSAQTRKTYARRLQRGRELYGQMRQNTLVKTIGRARRQALSERLDRAAHVVATLLASLGSA